MEYAAYVSNGLNLTPATAGSPDHRRTGQPREHGRTPSTSSRTEKAVGGRLGFWWPEAGLEAGFSAMYNGDYIAGGFEDSMSLWAVDFNYHKGNWDVRAEYGMTYQQAQPFQLGDRAPTSPARASMARSPTGRGTAPTNTCRTSSWSTGTATSISRDRPDDPGPDHLLNSDRRARAAAAERGRHQLLFLSPNGAEVRVSDQRRTRVPSPRQPVPDRTGLGMVAAGWRRTGTDGKLGRRTGSCESMRNRWLAGSVLVLGASCPGGRGLSSTLRSTSRTTRRPRAAANAVAGKEGELRAATKIR